MTTKGRHATSAASMRQGVRREPRPERIAHLPRRRVRLAFFGKRWENVVTHPRVDVARDRTPREEVLHERVRVVGEKHGTDGERFAVEPVGFSVE